MDRGSYTCSLLRLGDASGTVLRLMWWSEERYGFFGIQFLKYGNLVDGVNDLNIELPKALYT